MYCVSAYFLYRQCVLCQYSLLSTPSLRSLYSGSANCSQSDLEVGNKLLRDGVISVLQPVAIPTDERTPSYQIWRR